MKELYQQLKKIEHRPSLYTGQISLKAVSTYIVGYREGLIDGGLIEDNEIGGTNFHDWVAQHLGFNESTAGWCNMIVAVSIGLEPNEFDWEGFDTMMSEEQHESSVKMFYELLETYMNDSSSLDL